MGANSLSSIGTRFSASAEEASSIGAGLAPIAADTAGELVQAAVVRVIEHGHRVTGSRPNTEVLHQALCQRDPRWRVIATPQSSFSPAVAVARLVWHLGARSDLASIEFYEPRARLFSDDGAVLPGSNTGARLLSAHSGPNQIRGMIDRLREDPASRRAMAVVWRPEDAARASRDIPCTLALAGHLRDGQLVTSAIMRSNNALRLLPYNLFEFTMLAELIAVEAGVELGPYWHSVLSLHVFDEDSEAAMRLARAEGASGVGMPPMPGPHPLNDATALAAHEEKLREAFRGEQWGQLPLLVERAKAELNPYWFGLYAVLALFSLSRSGGGAEILDVAQLEQATPAALRRR